MPYIGTSPTQGVRVRYIYTATSSQTAFSGADANGVTLRYQDEEYVDVYKNGLILKTGTDYSLSNNTTMTLASGASNGDKIAIIVYDVFNVTVDDAYTKSPADSRFVNVAGDTMSGALDLNGVELVLDADADTSITADTDDQIDIKIAGADDFVFKANTFEVQTGSNIDMNGTELILDADGDTSITADTDDQIDIKIAGVEHISLTDSSGSTVIKPRVDAKDVIFQQFDGNEVMRVSDGRKLKFFDDGGESITSDGSNLKLESGGTTFTVPSSDGSNGQFLKTDGSGALSFGTVSTSVAFDDVTAGDAAVNVTTTAGDITIDAQGNDTDIILKGTDGSSDTTFLTIDGSDAGHATFNNGITLSDGDLTVASGHGINFANSSNNSNMTSELLNDYEEGKIAAPVVKIGGTVCTIGASNGLFYTRIGRNVNVSVEFRITNKNGGSGQVTVDLPYTSASNQYTAGTVRIYDGTVYGREFSEIQSAESVIKFSLNENASATGNMAIPLNAYIFTSLHYTV